MEKRSIRAERILEILKENSVVTTKQLSETLDVSEMTIRRDVELLEKQNLVNVFFGGLTLNANTQEKTKDKNYEYEQEFSLYQEEKKRIAQKAASLIEPNDAILFDAGSTIEQIVNYIPDNFGIMVYSYSLAILNSICEMDNVKLIGCCGYYHKNTRVFESPEGIELIQKARINKAFMAARGVSEFGVTTAESHEVDMKRAAIEASEKKILLADSSKIGKTWYSKYADLSDIDIVITDTGIKDEYVKMMEKQHIKLYIV